MRRASHGTWVVSSVSGFCPTTQHFDSSGKLRAEARCCEGDCTTSGLGFRPHTGAIARNLCDEARLGLVSAGVELAAPDKIIVLRDDGGVFEPDVIGTRRRWQLQAGNDVAQVDGGVLGFQVPDAGHCVKVPSALCREVECTAGALTFTDKFTLPDGGTTYGEAPWSVPRRPAKRLKNFSGNNEGY